ncbi:class D sortase [Paenibacillus filicis]|uniref:Class D sortase n=1 Tax=Paenibacillus filicis TaxID=669464 RepID=A0ABU9DTL0_9BACL
MRKGAIALVLVGLCTIAYPHVQQAREDQQQRELLVSLQAFSAMEEAGEASELAAGLEEQQGEAPSGSTLPASSGSGTLTSEGSAAPASGTTASAQPSDPKAEPAQKRQAESKPTAIGVIEIPSIDSRLPILSGVSEANMRLGAVHFKGTAMPGETGNAVIAAHRSLSYGRLFNRLVELKAGDTVVVRVGSTKTEFTVTATAIVEPDEVSVLKQSRTGAFLTLITCDPIDTGTHRFIVHAVASGKS